MLGFLTGRYLLFGILGVEALVLPLFLPKEVYGEVEFLKFTAFLTQFLLIGSATGFIVRYLKEPFHQRDYLSRVFVVGACTQAAAVSVIFWLFGLNIIASLSFLAMMALVYESISKVHERYLLGMSFKPILSLALISLIPLFLVTEVEIGGYIVFGFFLAAVIYIGLIQYFLKQDKREFIEWVKDIRLVWLVDYVKNIKHGFIVNISTAMIFLFFYIDRALIRDNYPDYLADYSLSFSIMQLTIVAISAFSYVNIVEFGKSQDDVKAIKLKVINSLRKCFFLFIVLGAFSSMFSYFATIFYGYDEVFKTTCLMLALFGLANVFVSMNAVHLYLGTVNRVALLTLVAFSISFSMNYLIDFNSADGYYILLSKTYGIYFLYALFSFLFAAKKLGLVRSMYKV